MVGKWDFVEFFDLLELISGQISFKVGPLILIKIKMIFVNICVFNVKSTTFVVKSSHPIFSILSILFMFSILSNFFLLVHIFNFVHIFILWQIVNSVKVCNIDWQNQVTLIFQFCPFSILLIFFSFCPILTFWSTFSILSRLSFCDHLWIQCQVCNIHPYNDH